MQRSSSVLSSKFIKINKLGNNNNGDRMWIFKPFYWLQNLSNSSDVITSDIEIGIHDDGGVIDSNDDILSTDMDASDCQSSFEDTTINSIDDSLSSGMDDW